MENSLLKKKPKGLFLNPAKAQCSIFESGRMMYDALLFSNSYTLDYNEVSNTSRLISTDYDFYVFNYHHNTMHWLDTKRLNILPGIKITFVLETLPNDPFVLCPAGDFDFYCAVDPTMNVSNERVFPFPRPLETCNINNYTPELDIPVIGTFGFATEGKGFDLVVEAVNKEFNRAKVKINIPFGTYVEQSHHQNDAENYAFVLGRKAKSVAKEGIIVEVTHDYMNNPGLINWCGQNTLNCFLYTRDLPGLSATTDQAIASGRPLSISDNKTFRHIHPYIKPYPSLSLRDSIATSQEAVKRMQRDWHPQNFALKFEKVLEKAGLFDYQTRQTRKIKAKKIKIPSLDRSDFRTKMESLFKIFT